MSNYLKAYIDLKAFRNNIDFVKKKFPKAKIILPVKANAYGHDSIIISKEAEKIKIDYLGVARISEGIKLRDNNIKLPIICLGAELGENILSAILNKIELTVSSLSNIKEIENICEKKKIKASIHLKIDTGMRRLGCNFNECFECAEFIDKSKHLKLKSVFTHFAKSESDKKLTQKQTNEFIDFLKHLENKKITYDFIHLFNSGGILNPPKISEIKNFAVRPGIISYGYTPSKNDQNDSLKPVMTLVSKVINVKMVPKGSGVSYGHTFKTKRNSYLATIALGYGDGFFRSLSNKFSVKINNKIYKQVGTISMDLTVIEADENVKVGDEVFIFGNKISCSNDAKELADKIKTISYEVTTSLTERVERAILK